MFTSPLLAKIPHINHGFFTRKHPKKGASTASYILSTLQGSHLLSVDQKHTSRVMTVDHSSDVDAPDTENGKIIADALVTETKGLILSVYTADCAPILLSDKKIPLIAAVHGGWKGLFSGVLENTLDHMRDHGGRDIVAAIGPCIHQKSYEVGHEFCAHFQVSSVSHYGEFQDFFYAIPGQENERKFLFNLPYLAAQILEHHGVKVEPLVHNTYTQIQDFFSYRRNAHDGIALEGCQMSGICLV